MWPLIEHKMCRRASLDAKHVKPGRWAPAAGDHTESSISATTFKLGFDRNNMKPSSFVSGSCWCNRVGGNFLAHCTVFYPPSDASLQQDDAGCHKSHIISNCFLENENQFSALKQPSGSSDFHPAEHLWDVVEREMGVRHVLLLCDAHRSVWTKMSEEGFDHNRNSWVLFFCFFVFLKSVFQCLQRQISFSGWIAAK